MSLAIGVHLGQYVMFASDQRRTFFTKDLSAVTRMQDGGAKLFRTHAGLITGTGYAPLLHGVALRIHRERLTDLDVILAVIEEERGRVERDPDLSPEVKAVALSTTGWMLTHPTADGVGCAVYHPCRGHQFVHGGPGDFICWVADGVKDVEDALLATLRSRRRVCGAGDDLSASIAEHTDLLRSLVVEASVALEKISPQCEIGIHSASGETVITPLLHPWWDEIGAISKTAAPAEPVPAPVAV